MKFIVCLLSSSVLAVSAMAADAKDLKGSSTALLNYHKAYQEADKSVVTARELVNSASEATASATAKFNKLEAAYKQKYGTQAWWALGAGEGDATAKAEVDAAEAKKNEAIKAENEAKKKVKAATDELQKAGKGKNAAKAQIEEAWESINALFQQQGLMMKMSELQTATGDLKTAQFALSHKLDKAVIGAYVKDKMKNMLNDKDLFCGAKNQCDGKGGPVTDKSMDRLFNGGMSAPQSAGASASAGATK